MTADNTTPPPAAAGLPGLTGGGLPDPGTPWGRLFLAVVLCGGAFAWLVSNFTNVQPVLEHPITMMVWTWLCFIMGGSSVYVLIARQEKAARMAAEDVIRRFRDRERDWLTERGDLKAELARLTERVEYLTRDVDRLVRERLDEHTGSGKLPQETAEGAEG